jgi:hypothetical protein
LVEARVRLLFCHTCRSVQAVPEFHGPIEYDDTLNYRLAEHLFADGRSHELVVGDIEEEQWAKKTVRDDIIFHMAEEMGFVPPGSGDGLGPTFYAVKATYEEDAIMCWKKHKRTLDCGDYRTDKMRILPDTRGDRKELGLSPRRQPQWLCSFCPVQSIKDQKQRAAAGSYEDPYK